MDILNFLYSIKNPLISSITFLVIYLLLDFPSNHPNEFFISYILYTISLELMDIKDLLNKILNKNI